MLQLGAHVLAVVGGPLRERRAVRLAGLVVEERPRVVRRLRELGRDDVGAELLEPLDVLLRRAVLGQCRAADRRWPGEHADREPAQPRLGHGRAREHGPRERDLLDGVGHRADGVEGGARAGTRRRSGCAPSSASGRRARSRRPAGGSSSRCPSPGRGRRGRPTSAAALPPDEPPVVLPGMCWVLHRPVPGVLARDAPRELVQVRLADDDGAGRHEALHRGRGSGRHVIRVDLRAVGGADPGGVDQVLDEQPLAVQRSRSAPAAARPR